MVKELHGKLTRFLSDALLLSACCLFLTSVGNPFLKNPSEYLACGSIQGNPTYPHCTPYPAYYWSFQVFHCAFNKMTQFSSYWFSNFAEVPTFRAQAPMLLIAMFLAQILTIAAGLLSLGLRKGWIRLIPFVSSATVILLMNFMHNELRIDYEIGYWLVYPSILLFLLAFTTCLIASRRKRQKEKTTDSK